MLGECSDLLPLEKAMLWEVIDLTRNPMTLVEVRGISKRRKKPFILNLEQYLDVLDTLVVQLTCTYTVSPSTVAGTRLGIPIGRCWTRRVLPSEFSRN